MQCMILLIQYSLNYKIVEMENRLVVSRGGCGCRVQGRYDYTQVAGGRSLQDGIILYLDRGGGYRKLHMIK